MGKLRNKKYQVFCLLLIVMLLIHQHIFLYADDLYYSRDASYGLSNLPNFMLGQLNGNGRVWIGTMMLVILKYNIYVFRLFNPLVITLTAILIAKISTSYPEDHNSRIKDEIVVASLCSSLFFIFLPIQIANTTIYYAACAFNYLYPTALVLLYGYTLHNHYVKMPNPKTNYWILLLAFLVGSSTQQVGAMGIGYMVLIPAYFKISRKKNILQSLVPYYLALFGGYSIVTYGSIKRMLFERQTGHVVNLKDVASGLLKTNIFSIPASGYVLIICLCCLVWLYSFRNQDFKKIAFLWHSLLIAALTIGILGYIYVVLYKKYPIHLFSGGTPNTLLSLCLIVFAAVYLISIVYIALLILINQRYPFLFYNSINAIGAQLMLFVADARFAEAYKIMFPSLLLMSIFIVYSFINFYRYKVFLLLSMIVILLSLTHLGKLTLNPLIDHANNPPIYQLALVIIGVSLFMIIGYYKQRTLKDLVVITIIMLGLFNLGTEYNGYKQASYAQDFNLDTISRYHLNHNPNELILKKTPGTIYGYNVSNWNRMPYFMKQCYRIPEEMSIRYID
ncbi:hypothetical protein [Desulfosporosinus sp. OT]|uniref:DUF6056 family protein n=1 Tax=Desulfosporosinus sp. OT TaxID=913865 RepID=UPI001A980E98|nr:hypothetical protein [Desulfosporosinus sp. OT]